MRRWTGTILFSIAAVWMTTSCAFQAPSVSTHTAPDNPQAVLYGHFDINHDFAMENQLGLWLQDLDTGKPVYVFFAVDQPIKAILVQPGRYQVVGFVGINRSHKIKGRWLFHHNNQIPPPFIAQAGTPTYLGNFSGKVTFDGFMATWGIESWQNHFEDTTAEFRLKYPQLRYLLPASIFQTGEPHRLII